MGRLSDAVDSIEFEWTPVVKIGNKGRSEDPESEGRVDSACGRRGEFRPYVYRIAPRLALMLEPDRLGGIKISRKCRRNVGA